MNAVTHWFDPKEHVASLAARGWQPRPPALGAQLRYVAPVGTCMAPLVVENRDTVVIEATTDYQPGDLCEIRWKQWVLDQAPPGSAPHAIKLVEDVFGERWIVCSDGMCRLDETCDGVVGVVRAIHRTEPAHAALISPNAVTISYAAADAGPDTFTDTLTAALDLTFTPDAAGRVRLAADVEAKQDLAGCYLRPLIIQGASTTYGDQWYPDDAGLFINRSWTISADVVASTSVTCRLSVYAPLGVTLTTQNIRLDARLVKR